MTIYICKILFIFVTFKVILKMVKVKKTAKVRSLLVETSGNETYVVNSVQENDEEMIGHENSDGEEERETGDSEMSQGAPSKRIKLGPKKVQKQEMLFHEKSEGEEEEEETEGKRDTEMSEGVPSKRMKPGPKSKVQKGRISHEKLEREEGEEKNGSMYEDSSKRTKPGPKSKAQKKWFSPEKSEKMEVNEENNDPDMSEDIPLKRTKPGPKSKVQKKGIPHERQESEEKSDDSDMSEDVPLKKTKPGPKSKVLKKGQISSKKSESEGEDTDEEENDSGMSEDSLPKETKPAPKKAQKVKENEAKPQANLAKVLKAKGRNQKTAAVSKKTNNPDLQPSKSGVKQKMLEIILNGLSTMDAKKGVSFPALKKYIMEEDQASSLLSWERVRPKIKAALEQGIQEELIMRPRGSENVAGLQGSFKLNKAKYASRNSNKGKEKNTKAKDPTTTKMSKPGTSKIPLKTKSKEAENLPKKAVGKIKHRRSVSEDLGMHEFKGKKLKKSKSLEVVAKGPKKKVQKVKKKATPKK